jgi:hypothetical protein
MLMVRMITSDKEHTQISMPSEQFKLDTERARYNTVHDMPN